MKYIIFLCLTLVCSCVYAQTPTVIPPSTTIEAFSALTPGQYLFISTTGNKDSTSIGLDKSLVCTPTVPCPKVDTAAIQALKICPVCPQQRSLSGLSYNPITNQWIVTYTDNSTTIFVPTKTLFIQ